MARIKLGALITEMSGSIGGFSVQKNHYGTSLKVKNNPIRSISQSQSLRRGEISSLIPLWQNLTEAQRLQWNNYSSYNRQTAKNNSDSLLSGYNLFLKYNVLRLYAGLSVILSPTYGISNFVNILPISVIIPPSPLWVALSYGANSVNTSADGKNWVQRAAGLFNNVGMHVCFNGTIWVAGAYGVNTLSYSTNGVTWVGLGATIFTTNCEYIIWDGSKFIAGGSGGNTFAHSSDGIHWSADGSAIISSVVSGLAYNGYLYIAVGAGTNTIAHSTDGITWYGAGSTTFSSSGRCVIWDGSKFLAGGQGTNVLAYSTDGISWSPITCSNFTNIITISFNGTIYLLGGIGSVICQYSTTLTSFTTVTGITNTGTCYKIKWNGTLFVLARGSSGNLLYWSADGISWSLRTSAPTGGWYQGLGTFPDPTLIPVITSNNLNFASNINITSMSCIIKSSMPLSSPNSILHKKLRIIPGVTISANGISWGSNFLSIWGRNPIANEWLTIEITFFSLVSSIVYKPVTQLCQLT